MICGLAFGGGVLAWVVFDLVNSVVVLLFVWFWFDLLLFAVGYFI